MAKKDKVKILGEEWSDERVKGFLNTRAVDGESEDFHILLTAYRGMEAEKFSRFVRFYVEAGRDINATNQRGETLQHIVSQHACNKEYKDALAQAGANS
ncbi:MAG: PA4642 family protein [Pseudomonadales bacterium]|nr:PA4642 family protein [Pseudomonadales bacterium]